MSTWIQALKEYNKDGMWCMPRKGTAEHAKVKAIMEKLKAKVVTNSGKARQKRIEVSTPPESNISKMEVPKRKLRTAKEKKEAEMMGMEDKDAPEMKVVRRKLSKEEKCPICGKMFLNLKQHMFKSHTKIHLTFKKDGDEYLLDAVTNDGTVLATNEDSDSTVYNTDGSEESQYFMGQQLVGWYVTLSKDKKVKVTSSTIHPKTGTESSATAFKNWDVKFIENENWKKLPQPKKEVEEYKSVVPYKSKAELKKEKEEKERKKKEVVVLTPAQEKSKEKRIDKKWKDEINKKKKEREELERDALTNERAKDYLNSLKKMDKYNLERTGNIYGVSRPLV